MSTSENKNAKFGSKSECPKFSGLHPMIPSRYVMEWKTDMKNRKQILKNAEAAGIYTAPHQESLFLEKRERLTLMEPASRVDAKYQLPPRFQRLSPPNASHLSTYKSELLYRTFLQ